MKLVLATSNPHKVREVEDIVAPFDVEIVGLDAFSVTCVEPVEDGLTFEDNARIKARSYAAQLGHACLAEDSGLEVDALHGAPGVHSARYSGEGGPRAERDELNNQRLLRELALVPESERSARFVCAMCIAEPDGRIVAEARGTYSGRIAFEARGTAGFGYDPLLYIEDMSCTSAQLSPAEKHARSHRGAAMRELLSKLGAGQRTK